mgnify:CR=1 FL=1
MPVETELKLTLSPADVPRLLRHRLLASQAKDRPRRQTLLNIYYDTPDLQLHRQRVALRLRRTGKRWVQTIKMQGRAVGGLHQRPEWEQETAAGTLRLEELPEGDIRHAFAQASLRSALHG